MPKYVKLFNQFFDFVRIAKESLTDPYECKLVNIILEHFDEVADAGTAQGKRGHLLNSLIQRFGGTVLAELPKFKDAATITAYPFHRLERIEVEDFRGFTKHETITFDKTYTFIYGPNGSGKSSLCEALEYSLLGYIDEAINRRIDIVQYIRNGFTGRARTPKLTGIDNNGAEIEVTSDSSVFYFCFIEKNRIEDFGRISANTPNDRRNLLAALFGLSEFTDFVANFTKNIENYIDIEGKAGQILAQLSAGIEVQRKNIEAAKQQLLALEESKPKIIEESGLQMDFAALEVSIHGNDVKQGRLEYLTSLLSGAIPNEVKISSTEEIDRAVSSISTDLSNCQTLYDEYKKSSAKVQFRALYTATLELQHLSPDKCPLCETPVDRATQHPFINAQSKLKELAQISQLETRLQQGVSDLRSKMQAFFTAVQERQKAGTALKAKLELPVLTPTAKDELWLFQAMATDFRSALKAWQACRPQNLKLDEIAATHNKTLRELTTERKKLEEERKMLSKLSVVITTLNTQISTLQTQMATWKTEVHEFTSKNASLIKKAEDEKTTIVQNQRFVKAYNTFLSTLSSYRDDLPIRHLRQLNSLTVDLYNIINHGDRHFEKVASITLPSTIDESISISFADDPSHRVDALHVLSEGHIRCLGLAILLAKNIHEKPPLVIFDDVVNAIDDDHRSGVRKVVFSQNYMTGKQVILTTHAEQFVKELEQHLTKPEYDMLVKKLSFFIDAQERTIRIKDDQQNYLCVIESECTIGHWSKALYNARCCLESLTNKLWARLGRREFNTEFSVVIRMPNGKPDLMSVVESLNKFLKKIDGAGRFQDICDVFGYLLGLQSSSKIIWQYLNKGTHEEEGRPEFDHTIVTEIAKKLMKLDTLVKAI